MNKRTFLALWIILMFACDARAASSADTKAREDIIVYLGNNKLSIPRAYISNGVGPEHVTAIWLPLFLPDLTPAQKNFSLFNKMGWDNKMTVLLEANSQFRNPQEVANETLGWAHIAKSDYTKLPNHCKLYTGNMVTAHELYLCDLPDHILEVQCGGKGSSKFPTCTVFENPTKDVTAIYHYGIEHENEMVEIDTNLRRIYGKFCDCQVKD